MPPIAGGSSYESLLTHLRVLAVPPIPLGPSYVSLISYPRVLAVPPIPWGPFIRISYFIPEGIGGAANTLGGPLYVFLISYPRVLAVPPIPWGPFIRISYFIPEGIGGAANTLGALYTYFLFHTRQLDGNLSKIHSQLKFGYTVSNTCLFKNKLYLIFRYMGVGCP